MTIEADYSLEVDKNILNATQGKSFSRLLKRPRIAQIFEEILTQLPKLYEPKLIWDIFPVKNIQGKSFLLENGTVIGGGPVSYVMKEATQVILGVCTVGIRFDEKIDEYYQAGNNLAAVILDGIASFLVDQVRETFFKNMNQKLLNEGKFLSIPLCPGESAWDVSDHAKFFELLQPELISMSLKESMLMIPMKSLSFMLGVAAQPFKIKDKTRCDFCPMQAKCRYSQSKLGKTLCND
ncbi:MAG: hypothetical protein ACTSVZ_04470 [Promethearchaeota archaeon]